MTGEWFVLVESNTTGTGRLFAARARDLGLRPVLLTRDASRYPYVAEDRIEHRRVDTADLAAVRQACLALGGSIAGVTSSSEYSIGTAAAVARSFGLAHPDPAAIRDCRDKHTQRVRLDAAGVPGPRFARATTPAAAAAAAAAIGRPVVVKPIAGSGSIGVRRCAAPAEAAAAAAAILSVDPAELALPPQGAVVVEEYLTGAEFSVETLDVDVVGITAKHLGPEPYFLEVGHDFPAPLPAADRVALADAAVGALRALGLGWGAAHVELRHTPDGPRIVEVNPRLAGGMIPRMVQEATGIDMIFHMVARAAGRPVRPQASRAGSASIRFLVAEVSGKLVDVTGVRQARRVPGVVEVGLTSAPGRDITLRHSFQDRLGFVISSAGTVEFAARAADQGLAALRAEIVPVPRDEAAPASRDEAVPAAPGPNSPASREEAVPAPFGGGSASQAGPDASFVREGEQHP